jgi:hypothetical protein
VSRLGGASGRGGAVCRSVREQQRARVATRRRLKGGRDLGSRVKSFIVKVLDDITAGFRGM